MTLTEVYAKQKSDEFPPKLVFGVVEPGLFVSLELNSLKEYAYEFDGYASSHPVLKDGQYANLPVLKKVSV